MLYDPGRHAPLQAIAWDQAAVRQTIAQIVDDAEARFTPDHFWPPHPRDLEGKGPVDQPYTPLYFGACGVVWGLHYLQDLGAIQLQRNYLPYLDAIQQRNRDWLGSGYAEATGSYLMGDTPFALMACVAHQNAPEYDDTLATLIEGNIAHPARELMWGSPGTLLAALMMHRACGDARWAELFLRTARKLWSQLVWSAEHQCHYWTQDLYGQQSTYLDAVHGFVATASPLIGGRHLMPAHEWAAWERCIANTVGRTASHEGDQVNWRAWLITPEGAKPRYLMQFCHGAPGFIICLGDLPGQELDALLLQAGETVWTAGPLQKGSNLCHGTGGNGYAFLKLYQRTGDELWLQRARAFAMHGIAQTRADALQFGQHRYSLWTGDPGFAIYLWDCLQGSARFPTLDAFFASSHQRGAPVLNANPRVT